MYSRKQEIIQKSKGKRDTVQYLGSSRPIKRVKNTTRLLKGWQQDDTEKMRIGNVLTVHL